MQVQGLEFGFLSPHMKSQAWPRMPVTLVLQRDNWIRGTHWLASLTEPVSSVKNQGPKGKQRVRGEDTDVKF